MDLSKKQKNRRDAVEAPLFQLEKMLDLLEEIHTRTDAAVKVWPETERTLGPALRRQETMEKELDALREKLQELWQFGFTRKWKNFEK